MASELPIEAPTAALNAIIRGSTAPAAIKEDLAGFLRAQGVDGADLDAMVAVGAERMLVYRSLVHNRMRNAARDYIPRTVARLGRARFIADFTAFMDEQGARSHYLRDVPAEIVEFFVARWQADPDVPGYIPDLARHELLDADVRNDWRGGEAETGLPLALDRPLRFDGATRLVNYGHPVHTLPRELDDRTVPPAEPTPLLVYRDEQHRPRYLALTTFAAAVLHELIDNGLPVQGALVAAAQALGESLDDDKLGSAALLFADLAERGVCLGAEPTTES
ncbi:MAG: putative DNA-binding domain-containing protein [Deltaproteobacteria bacterium]|nr:putative DNA-binding domain-containing protein [Deltaproteobacteria bacterium]